MLAPDHTTTALPDASRATCGSAALVSGADRSTGGPNVCPAGRNETCALSLAPSSARVHVASASPAPSKVTRGTDAYTFALALPALEIETGAWKSPPAGRNAV